MQLWGNDTELSGSVNDAAFVRLATGTVSATWQCADSQGFAYCLTSSRDTAVKTDGSVANTTYQTSIPLGTMLTFTPLQLVVAGVSANESTLYISGQNAFTNFTIGVLPSSPFTEPIASPGSRITHVAFYFGKLFWWKDQSFGYATFTNQFDWQLTIVSNQIGTLDNSDAFWNSSGFDAGTQFSGTAHANAEKSPGGIFFRGQDNHFYVYDGYYLTRLSRSITPSVTAANRRKANSWSQTTQADFQTGSNIPTNNISETISPGDVIVSSFQAIEQSSTQWNSGIATNITVGVSSLTLTTNNSGNITNPDFESAFAGNWTGSGNAGEQLTKKANASWPCGTLNPQTGSAFAESEGASTNNFQGFFIISDATTNALLANSTLTASLNDCVWHQVTLTPSTAYIGERFKIILQIKSGVSPGVSGFTTTSDSYILGGPISFYYDTTSSGANEFVAFDNITLGSSTITSGSFTSQAYNTGFTSSTYQLQSSFSAFTSTPSFILQTSTSSLGVWSNLLTSTGTNGIGNQFARYISSFTVGSGDNAFSFISTETIVSRSTGTYFSAVKNAPNLTTWGTFNATDLYPGVSSITYYSRASTNSFSVLSTTPSWVSQIKNANVSPSTGTFFQLRGDFYLFAATEAPTLNDFSFNWFEGTAADKAYISYFNDAIWFSVSASTSASTNNRIFYWDILNGAWLVYDIAANGFQIENNALYFGDPVQGRVFKFGGVTTDNAVAINSYWRSKSFLGADPFVQNEFVQADFVLGESSTTLTYTYTLDSKTSTAYVITAYDAAASLIQRNFLLPAGKIGKYYDFRIGDNSSNASWKLMAHRAHYNKLNWQPVLR